jgi:hypothetical protein
VVGPCEDMPNAPSGYVKDEDSLEQVVNMVSASERYIFISLYQKIWPSKLAQAVTLTSFIQEVLRSSLGQDTYYIDWGFSGLFQNLQAITEDTEDITSY